MDLCEFIRTLWHIKCMKLDLEPGVYVLAVSGGVDSMVLLDLAADLAKNQSKSKKYWFVVAHFDHGIREDSDEDRMLVERMAKKCGFPFVYDVAKLGPNASEAVARKARYGFFSRVRRAAHADAVITAHHEDDLIETAILNLLRGTGRKGLSSLSNGNGLMRPLLCYSKSQMYAYAKTHDLEWREDSTNKNNKYRRNQVRENIVAKMTGAERKKMLRVLSDAKKVNTKLDYQIAKLLQFASRNQRLDRGFFIGLPHKVALEVMAAWLRKNEIRQLDRKLLERLVNAAKAFPGGKQTDVNGNKTLKIQGGEIEITTK